MADEIQNTSAEATIRVNQAKAAYDDNDSKEVIRLCNEALAFEPENFEAWGLLARFGGWDSKMLDFDRDLILRTIRHYMDMVPEESRFDTASEVYTARKRQIAERLEAAMMMPSFEGAKQVHAIMGDWKRLLVDIPYLTPSLIESEINVCTNICNRSKIGIMPTDRLVYTAYATFNGKQNYGDTFREALAGRVEREAQREQKRLAEAQARAEDRMREYQDKVAAGELSAADERSLLEGEIADLNKQIADLEGLSSKRLYEEQIEELKSQQELVPVYKLFKRKKYDERIAELEAKVDQIDAQLAESTSPIRAQLETYQARLAEL